jgi:hypothetical protein
MTRKARKPAVMAKPSSSRSAMSARSASLSIEECRIEIAYLITHPPGRLIWHGWSVQSGAAVGSAVR